MSPPNAVVGGSDKETMALVYRHLLSVSREMAEMFKDEFSLSEQKDPTEAVTRLNLEEIARESQLVAETLELNSMIYRHLLSCSPQMAREFKAEFGLLPTATEADTSYSLDDLVNQSPLVAASPIGKKRNR